MSYSLLFSCSLIRRHPSVRILYITLYKGKLNHVVLLFGYSWLKSLSHHRLCWFSSFLGFLQSFQVQTGLNVATTMALHNVSLSLFFVVQKFQFYCFDK